ncbi:MAG TPA: RNA methyltransferase [Leptolinea sp.]
MIKSKKNSHLQLIRSLLQDRKSRDETGQFVIEGVRLVEDAANNKASISEVYFSQSLSERGRIQLNKFVNNGILIEEVEDSIFSNLMDTSTSQGIAAICKKTEPDLPENLNFAIIADQLRDPGNLGTILRTAAAAGAQAVITTPGSVDLYSPKVLRSAMGAHFHIACAEMVWEQLEAIKQKQTGSQLSAYVAAIGGQKIFWQCDFTRPTLLIIGNEAEGATEKAFEYSDHRISIPMPGEFESLNAAVAAGVLIFEVVRQRNKQQTVKDT